MADIGDILRINLSNPSAVKTASILDLKLVQVFARVSLATPPALSSLDQILEFVVRLCIDP
jgi:hypothetical protein